MASENLTLREVMLADVYEQNETALKKRIAELEAALHEIIDHVEKFSDGSWSEDMPEVIARKALGPA